MDCGLHFRAISPKAPLAGAQYLFEFNSEQKPLRGTAECAAKARSGLENPAEKTQDVVPDGCRDYAPMARVSSINGFFYNAKIMNINNNLKDIRHNLV